MNLDSCLSTLLVEMIKGGRDLVGLSPLRGILFSIVLGDVTIDHNTNREISRAKANLKKKL